MATFRAGEGWGLFHDKACSEAFAEARYFDLADYERKHSEMVA